MCHGNYIYIDLHIVNQVIAIEHFFDQDKMFHRQNVCAVSILMLTD